jgi:hypothetical protein
MLQKFIIISLIAICTSSFNWTFGQNEKNPEINIVYGEKHIFTIETPDEWINDKESAQKIGLVCFFYPKSEINKFNVNYCYAHGHDKETPDENLDDFIKGDLEKFREKYPEFTFEKIPVGITGGLRNGVLYSFSNLTDRFKEEVLYSETDDSFIIFSFAAMTEEDYKKYQPVFDGFISSFNYRGNNPQPFLDYLNKKGQ